MSDGGLYIPKELQKEIYHRIENTSLHYDTEFETFVMTYNPTGHKQIMKYKPWWKFWKQQHYLIKIHE